MFGWFRRSDSEDGNVDNNFNGLSNYIDRARNLERENVDAREKLDKLIQEKQKLLTENEKVTEDHEASTKRFISVLESIFQLSLGVVLRIYTSYIYAISNLYFPF